MNVKDSPPDIFGMSLLTFRKRHKRIKELKPKTGISSKSIFNIILQPRKILCSKRKPCLNLTVTRSINDEMANSTYILRMLESKLFLSYVTIYVRSRLTEFTQLQEIFKHGGFWKY